MLFVGVSTFVMASKASRSSMGISSPKSSFSCELISLSLTFLDGGGDALAANVGRFLSGSLGFCSSCNFCSRGMVDNELLGAPTLSSCVVLSLVCILESRFGDGEEEWSMSNKSCTPVAERSNAC